jgi:hypothetical protein
VIGLEVQQEYNRIKALFEGVDEKQISLVDGSMWEAARLRVELDRLNEIVKLTGLVAVNPNNPAQQRELPISKMITKVRANYLSYISRLSALLGRDVNDDDDDLSEFE